MAYTPTQTKIFETLDEYKKLNGSLTPDQQKLYNDYTAVKTTPMQDLQQRYNMPLNKGAIANELNPKYDALLNGYNQTKNEIKQTTDQNAQALWGDYYQRIKAQQRNNIRKSALSGVQMANDILMNLQSQQAVAGMYNESNKAIKDVNTKIANADMQKQAEISDTYNNRSIFLNSQAQQEDYNKWSRHLQELGMLSNMAEAGVVTKDDLTNYYLENFTNPEQQDQMNLEALMQELESLKKQQVRKTKADVKASKNGTDLGKTMANLGKVSDLSTTAKDPLYWYKTFMNINSDKKG